MICLLVAILCTIFAFFILYVVIADALQKYKLECSIDNIPKNISKELFILNVHKCVVEHMLKGNVDVNSRICANINDKIQSLSLKTKRGYAGITFIMGTYLNWSDYIEKYKYFSGSTTYPVMGDSRASYTDNWYGVSAVKLWKGDNKVMRIELLHVLLGQINKRIAYFESRGG